MPAPIPIPIPPITPATSDEPAHRLEPAAPLDVPAQARTVVVPAGPAAPATPGPERLDRFERPTEAPPGATAISTHTIAPVPRVVGRRPRVRKVTRVVRHVDPWTVFKVAGAFSLVIYFVALTSGVLLWNVAHATGTIDNVERFFESFGWSEFEFNGGEIFHNVWIGGLFAAVGLTGAAVLTATLFNLLTDLVGGVRFTVLEEEVVERTTSPMRRFVVRRPTADPTGGVDLDVVRPPATPAEPPMSRSPAGPIASTVARGQSAVGLGASLVRPVLALRDGCSWGEQRPVEVHLSGRRIRKRGGAHRSSISNPQFFGGDTRSRTIRVISWGERGDPES